MTIRVVIADDQALFREGLRTLLETVPDLEIAGEAENGEQAVRLVCARRPHVVLMDLRMPEVDGVTATRRCRELAPETRVVALTTFDDDHSIFEALRAGACGYLLKDVSSKSLVEAITAAARGEAFLQPAVTAKVVFEFARLLEHKKTDVEIDLSRRELDVLRWLAVGQTNKEIASRLSIAEGTVKNHITNILEKLGATDRTQAAVKAKTIGLI